VKYTPLFLASLLLLVPGGGNDNLDNIKVNGKSCGLAGSAKSQAAKDLNKHKNRYQIPTEGDIDPEASLAAMVAPGSDYDRFDARRAAKVRGFVVDVKSGGKETCNCNSTDPKLWDTHIELALTPDAAENQRVIVEMTPRLRMVKAGEDWTTAAITEKFKGKWVEATGWLTFDTAHIPEAENTNPGNPSNWRATCWEVHPVTDITALDAPPAEVAGFQPASLKALQTLHAAHVARTRAGKESLAAVRKRYLDKFDKEDLEEVEEEAKERRPKH
jgi:hypothetical protein